VFFLLDHIPQMDLTPFHLYYAQELRGQPPFDVTMMVILLVLNPQGIREGSTPGSSRVTRAGWLGSIWQQ